MKKYKNFIDGKWLDNESKETIKVEDPATVNVPDPVVAILPDVLIERSFASSAVPTASSAISVAAITSPAIFADVTALSARLRCVIFVRTAIVV